MHSLADFWPVKLRALSSANSCLLNTRSSVVKEIATLSLQATVTRKPCSINLLVSV